MKASVNLHLDSSYRRKSDGKSKFYLRVNVGGEKKLYDILPELYLDAKFWITPIDPETGKAKRAKQISPSTPNYYDLQAKAFGKVAEMKDLIESLQKNSAESVSHGVIAQRWGLKKCETLWQFGEWYVEQRKEEWAASTLKCYLRIVESFKEYAPSIMVAHISYSWIFDFQRWLLNEKPRRVIVPRHGVKTISGYGLAPGTVRWVLTFLGSVLGEAITRKLLVNDPYAEFMRRGKAVRRKVAPINYLEKAQMLRLHEAWEKEELLKHQFTNSTGNVRPEKGIRLHDSLQQVLVALYTGLRFSDLRRLHDPSEFSLTKTHLRIVMKKTGKEVRIKLSGRLKQVMAVRPNGGILAGDVKSNTTLNRNLKLIQTLILGKIHIHKWHELRKSFASYLLQETGDLKAVSELLGHASTKTTEMIYAQVNTEQQDRAIDALDEMESKENELPSSKEFLEEMRVILAANPDMVLTPKMRKALEAVYGDMDFAGDGGNGETGSAGKKGRIEWVA